MALRWNTFTQKDRKPELRKEADESITTEKVKHIISTEVRAASMQNQVLSYLNDANAQGIRTEALMEEVKETISVSLERIEEAVAGNQQNEERLEEIHASVDKLAKTSQNLEASIHKDNLLTYKNIKVLLDDLEDNNRLRAGTLKRMLSLAIILLLIIIVGIALIGAKTIGVI